jgi:hypothetical protein
MAKFQLKGLCYNFDDKYFPGHKCKEQNIFMVMTKDVSEEEVVFSHVDEIPPPSYLTPPSDPPEFELVISLNALIGFSCPKTLKLIGYIKNMKVWIVEAHIILFIVALPHKSIGTYVSSIIFKS